MKIRVLAFASAGDAVGAGEMEVEVPEGSRVADLRGRLVARFPGLETLWPRLAVAVDGRLVGGVGGGVVGGGEVLREGVEVALLPPVSGAARPGRWGWSKDRSTWRRRSSRCGVRRGGRWCCSWARCATGMPGRWSRS